MKFKNLFIAALAVSATLVGCKEKEENLGTPEVSVSPTELNFDKAGTATTSNLVSLKATRDWHVNYSNDADKWVVVEPASGAGSSSAQEVSVTVLANDGFDRSATLTFDIGFGTASLVVNQEGTGSAEASIVYKNDFDATKAEQNPYGTGSSKSWPYLDQFDGWKNASGTGAGAEAYAFSGLSVRSNSTSNSNYSDYSGSGDNNLFFGRDNYFAITGIALSSDVNYTLSFGSEKYSQDGDSKFSHSEFHVYVSNDGAKWVELQYEFPNGDKEGRWDLASTTFTVPSGTTTLGLYFKSDVASTYRLDDVNLSVATQAGTAIDFSTGVDLGTGGNDTPSTDYDKAEAKTVAEFIAAANTSTYYKLSGKVSSFNPKWCSFDLTDGSGTIYVYSVANKSDWSDKISNGGTVTLAGLYAYYEAKSQHEVVNAQILSFEAAGDTPSEETAKGSGTLEDPYNPKAINDIAAALASGTNSDSDYYFKGKISSIKYTFNANYGTATFNVSEDGTTSGTQFQCYSVLYLGNRKWVDGDTQIAVGDEVVVCGKVTNYNGNTPETASQEAFIYSLNGQTSIEQGDAFGVASTALSVSATATSATIKVTGNVAWTASSDNATVSPTSGTGAGTVTVSFAENTDTENEKTYTVVVSTTADVATKSYTVTITQSKVSAAGEVTVTFNEEQLAKAACKGATVSMDDVISFTNSSDYGTNTVTQLRIYKGKILTVTAASGNITKIVFTCTANGKTKHGPGCFGTGAPEGYTFEENGKTGTWTGSAPSVAFTATDNQVRVSELSVTYVAQ